LHFQGIEGGLCLVEKMGKVCDGGIAGCAGGFRLGEFRHDGGIVHEGGQCVKGKEDNLLEVGFADNLLGKSLVVPEVGLCGLKFKVCENVTAAGDVKDSLASPPVLRVTGSVAD